MKCGEHGKTIDQRALESEQTSIPNSLPTMSQCKIDMLHFKFLIISESAHARLGGSIGTPTLGFCRFQHAARTSIRDTFSLGLQNNGNPFLNPRSSIDH